MGDAGRHLADRREALLDRGVAFELLDFGDVLKREQQAGAAARGFEVRRGDADLELAAAVGAGEAELLAPPPLGAEVVMDRRLHRAGPLQHFVEAAAAADLNGMPVIDSAARLNVRIRSRSSVVDEAARQAVDDVLVQRLQIGDLVGRLLEPRVRDSAGCRRASR